MILELYPKFPYFMSDELYRTIMLTITGILSSLIVFLLIRYFKYRKQKDFDKEVLNEKIRIELGAIAMGIKGCKNIQANGDFRDAYDAYMERETENSPILSSIKVTD